MKRLSIFIFAALLFCGATFVNANEVVVENPTYPNGDGPVIAVDGGHNNFHGLEGGFQVFGELATKDGYSVKSITEAFTKESLVGVDILVTATAMDAKNAAIVEPEKNGWVLSYNPLAPPNFANGLHAQSAYTDEEIAAIKDWVAEGGSLMLVTDHMPFPASQQALAKAFGVIFDNTFAFDEKFLLYAASQGQVGGNAKNLLKYYKSSEGVTDSNGALYSHKITDGIDYLTTFVGSSFRILGGIDYQPLMEMGTGTLLLYPYNHVTYQTLPPNQLSLPLAQGLLQGATLFYGKGRIAVFAEAAMFSSSTTNPENGIFNPQAPFNQVFALNTLGWLAEKTEVTCINLKLENGIEFTVPNLNMSGLKFGANFKWTGEELKFKMEKTALTEADANAQEISLSATDFTIPCINIEGVLYTVRFTCPSRNFVDWEFKDITQN